MRSSLPFLLSFAVIAVIGAACGDDASAMDPIEVSLDMLPCASATPAAGEPWESAPWPPSAVDACTWFPFDGDTSYRFEHGLGRTPRSVLVYVSFDADGRRSNIAPGDATRIISVDADVVELRNGTNQDFYAKVVLE